MCFVLILVFTLSLVSDVSPFSRKVFSSTSFHHAYATPIQSSFLLDVVVRLCPVVVNSICIPNSCIFHISKMGLLRCCLHKEGRANPNPKKEGPTPTSSPRRANLTPREGKANPTGRANPKLEEATPNSENCQPLPKRGKGQPPRPERRAKTPLRRKKTAHQNKKRRT